MQQQSRLMLAKYSLGIGDRFGKEGEAQLTALIKAKQILGIQISPVWNKSFREHQIIHTHPKDAALEAHTAVSNLAWEAEYFIDADHINKSNVNMFIPYSNYFTIDVADYIGQTPLDSDKTAQVASKFIDQFSAIWEKASHLPIKSDLNFNDASVNRILEKYMYTIQQAAEIYQYIHTHRKNSSFITEISMDETTSPQSPLELLIILCLVQYFQIPLDTIAPKFTGDFFKGIDYRGDITLFTQEFEADIIIVQFIQKYFEEMANLKLSIHSGSDKFSIYPIINQTLKKYDAGIHVKTAGTTWLEEIIGLSSGGEKGTTLVKKIYRLAYPRLPELIVPYQTVLDINQSNLPTPQEFQSWPQNQIVHSLSHDLEDPLYNCDLRQFFHIAYRIAADLGEEFEQALIQNKEIIGTHVTHNLYHRHIHPLFHGL